MKPIVAYYRASKSEQTNSIEVQRNQMREFVKNNSHAYYLVAEYSEHHTGKDRKRIELAKAIKHSSDQNCILGFTKIDRLSRLASHLLQIRDSGLDLICLDMPELNTLTFGIFATIAQHERELISSRTKVALAVVKKNKKLGNPNGWNGTQEKAQVSRKESRKKWLASIESERAKNIIELLFKNGTKNLNEIARNLNFQNIKTQRGGKWQPNQVNKFLADIGFNMNSKSN
jgi:DNA invertase Pin-like site-specific DNA recombinase